MTVTGDERGASSSLLRCTVAVTRHPITNSGRIMATVSRVSRLPGWRSQRDPSGSARGSRSLVGRLSMAGRRAGGVRHRGWSGREWGRKQHPSQGSAETSQSQQHDQQ